MKPNREAENRARAREAVALVGVDAGKLKHALVVRDAKGRDHPLEFKTHRAGFEEAVACIKAAVGTGAGPYDPAKVLVGIEFAGVYGVTFAHYLHGLGYDVVSVLPRTTKQLGRLVHGSRLKSDLKDALTIASALSNGYFARYPFLEPAYAELRTLANGAARLVITRTATVNRLKGVLQTVWPEFEKSFKFGFTQRRTPLALLDVYPGPRAFLEAGPAALETIRTVSLKHHGQTLFDELAAGARDTVGVRGAEMVLGNVR